MWSQFISRNQRNRMKSTSQMRSRQDSSQQWKGLHTCCHSDTWLRNSFTPPPPPPMAKRIRGFICILLIIHCLVSRLHLFMWACMSPLSSLPFFYFPSSPPLLISFFFSSFPLLFPRPLSLSSLPLLLLSTSLQSCHSLWSDVHSSCLKINIHTRVYCSNIVHTLFPSLHACMIYLQITMYTYREYKTPHINPLWLLWLAWEYDYIHILFSTFTTPTYIFLHPSPILHIRGIAQYRLVHRVLHTSATVLQYH